MAMIAEDVVELSDLSLELDTGSAVEVRGSSTNLFCNCTGACKTNRCVCRRLDHGCTPGRCKCKPSKCSRQKEEPAVNMEELGEPNSSDSEPEDFCICKDSCNNTLCYCLAIKQVPCTSQCKCDPDLCQNKTRVADPDAQTVPDVALPVKEDVQRYCATHSKKDLEGLLVAVASRCPQLWKSVSTSEKQVDPEKPYLQPPWCKCGKCHMEGDAEDQVCCKNHPKNHENPYFFQLCLDQQTLELALVNNCDWLNMPRIYTNSKFRNTAYRQYILWFHGKLGYRKRKRIPSCIKWAIRDMYPEASGEYVGYHEAL